MYIYLSFSLCLSIIFNNVLGVFSPARLLCLVCAEIGDKVELDKGSVSVFVIPPLSSLANPFQRNHQIQLYQRYQ